MLCPVCKTALPPNVTRCPKDGAKIATPDQKSRQAIAFEATSIQPYPEKSKPQDDAIESDEPELLGDGATSIQSLPKEEEATSFQAQATQLHSVALSKEEDTSFQSEGTAVVAVPDLRAESTQIHQVATSIQNAHTAIQKAPSSIQNEPTAIHKVPLGNPEKPFLLTDAPPETDIALLREEKTNLHKGAIDVELAPGVRLGEYIIEAYVGAGGMGEIWQGLQPQIAKKVAIKVLRSDLIHNKTALQRFIQEARAVNEIKHRNIVDIFAFGELPDGRPYFIMEFLEGHSLGHYLQEHGPLPFIEIASIFGQICRSLQAVHDRGIVHRDLKPDNIFLLQEEGDPFVKLLDFGIAKLNNPEVKGITRAGAIIGTPAYMSPEQCEGAHQIDHRTDVYALGVVLFELITGRTPFEEPDGGSGATLVKQMTMAPPPPSSMVQGREIPPEVDQFVIALLAKDPELRPSRCADLPGFFLQALGAKRGETWEELKNPVPIFASGVGAVKKKPSKSSQQGDYYTGALPTMPPKPTAAPPPRDLLRRYWWAAAAVLVLFGVSVGLLIANGSSKSAASSANFVSQQLSKDGLPSAPPVSVPASTPTQAPPGQAETPTNEKTGKEKKPKPKEKTETPTVIPSAVYQGMIDKTIKEIDFSSCRGLGTGRVLVKLTLNDKGKVTGVVTDSTPLGGCVAGVIKKTKFPQGGERSYKFSYPVYVK